MELLIRVGNKEFWFPDSIVNIGFVVIVLLIFAIYANKKIKATDIHDKPSGLLVILEALVTTIDKLVSDTMGAHNLKFAPYIFSLACYLAVANLLGLVGLNPPTSNYSVTFSLALITFVLTQIFKWRSNGGFFGYLKSFTEPLALITPINILGEIATPISLSFRLFGNVMSGGLIMLLVYRSLGYIAPIVTPVLHGYFDVFSGLLQTFIFIMLTMIYVGGDNE